MLRNYSFFSIFIHSDVTAHFNRLLPEPFILFGARQPRRTCVMFRSFVRPFHPLRYRLLLSLSKHRLIPLCFGRRLGEHGTFLRNQQMFRSLASVCFPKLLIKSTMMSRLRINWLLKALKGFSRFLLKETSKRVTWHKWLTVSNFNKEIKQNETDKLFWVYLCMYYEPKLRYIYQQTKPISTWP